jgi:hypothetical protein
MRLLFYSLLALLPLIGLSLNAASACGCPHAAGGAVATETVELEAVPCCQGAPMPCCVQHQRTVAPEPSLLGTLPSTDSLPRTLVAIATLAADRSIPRPTGALFVQQARSPPPLPVRAQRCRLQSWLI